MATIDWAVAMLPQKGEPMAMIQAHDPDRAVAARTAVECAKIAATLRAGVLDRNRSGLADGDGGTLP